MTTKEYLSQASRLEQSINTKLDQARTLREMATKVTTVFSDMPSSGTKDVHSMQNIITKMVDLEVEINNDIDELVDLKREIISLIKQIEKPEYRTLLELRYLCYKTWEQIAVLMNYTIRHVHRIHDEAVETLHFLKHVTK